MVMSALGPLPHTGEVFAWRGIRFEVVDLDGARIDKLLVTPIPRRSRDDGSQTPTCVMVWERLSRRCCWLLVQKHRY